MKSINQNEQRKGIDLNLGFMMSFIYPINVPMTIKATTDWVSLMTLKK